MRGFNRLASRLRRGRRSADQRFGPATLDRGIRLADGFSPEVLLTRHQGRPIPVLTDPPLIRAASLDAVADEPVLGIESDGEARAYPLAAMFRSHIANDRIGSRPILVAFCGKCFSGVGFDPLVGGDRLTFQVFGVYRGAFAMWDDQTGTIWSELSGEAVAGHHAGRRLPLLPTEITTLQRWVDRYPDSSAPAVRIEGVQRPVPQLPGDSAPWWMSVPEPDERLPLGSLVLGVELPDRSRAYPVERDRPEPYLLQDDVGDTPIVLLSEPGSLPLAYERRHEGIVLELRLEHGRILDQRGMEWSGRGRAIDDGAAQLPFTEIAAIPRTS